MSKTAKVRSIAVKAYACIRRFLFSNKWLGILWIGLGLSTWMNSRVSDVISVGGPMFVGVLCFIQLKPTNGIYYISAFAVAADRVLSYALFGLWNPLFVWLILGTYVLRGTKEHV